MDEPLTHASDYSVPINSRRFIIYPVLALVNWILTLTSQTECHIPFERLDPENLQWRYHNATGTLLSKRYDFKMFLLFIVTVNLR